MPPPTPPDGLPSSTVMPEMIPVVPVSTLSTRLVTEHEAKHVAWRMVVLWPPPLMVTVWGVLSLTSSCPLAESTL